MDTVYSSSKNKQLYNIYNGELIKFQPDTVEGSNMKCFGNKQKLAIEYEIMNKLTFIQYALALLIALIFLLIFKRK